MDIKLIFVIAFIAITSGQRIPSVYRPLVGIVDGLIDRRKEIISGITNPRSGIGIKYGNNIQFARRIRKLRNGSRRFRNIRRLRNSLRFRNLRRAVEKRSYRGRRDLSEHPHDLKHIRPNHRHHHHRHHHGHRRRRPTHVSVSVKPAGGSYRPGIRVTRDTNNRGSRPYYAGRLRPRFEPSAAQENVPVQEQSPSWGNVPSSGSSSSSWSSSPSWGQTQSWNNPPSRGGSIITGALRSILRRTFSPVTSIYRQLPLSQIISPVTGLLRRQQPQRIDNDRGVVTGFVDCEPEDDGISSEENWSRESEASIYSSEETREKSGSKKDQRKRQKSKRKGESSSSESLASDSSSSEIRRKNDKSINKPSPTKNKSKGKGQSRSSESLSSKSSSEEENKIGKISSRQGIVPPHRSSRKLETPKSEEAQEKGRERLSQSLATGSSSEKVGQLNSKDGQWQPPKPSVVTGIADTQDGKGAEQVDKTQDGTEKNVKETPQVGGYRPRK